LRIRVRRRPAYSSGERIIPVIRCPSNEGIDTIEVGDKAPDFRLARDGGSTVSLADFKGKKLVLYFYPKADTPGCTIEAKDFSRLHAAFSKAGVAVVGVSADPVKKQDAFKGHPGCVVPVRFAAKRGESLARTPGNCTQSNFCSLPLRRLFE